MKKETVLIVGVILGVCLGVSIAFLLFGSYIQASVNDGLAINDSMSQFLLGCYKEAS